MSAPTMLTVLAWPPLDAGLAASLASPTAALAPSLADGDESVEPAPAPAAPQWQGELLAIATSIPAGADRASARADIRAALCEVAGLLTSVGAERIEVTGSAGQVPRLLVDGDEIGIGISISHADTVSVAVLHRQGAVGVDLMRIGLPADWARVAHDYLGMASAILLAAASEQDRPLAFCQAWTRREAGLKLRGEMLVEWSGESAAGVTIELLLPDGLTGAVAI